MFFFFLLFLRVLKIFWVTFIRYKSCRDFLPVCGLFLYSLDSVCHKPVVFSYNEIQLAFGVVSKKSSSNPKVLRYFSVLSSSYFIVLHFTFGFKIHFQLIFVKKYEDFVQFNFFASECLVVPALFGKDHSSLCYLCIFVKNQLTVIVYI